MSHSMLVSLKLHRAPDIVEFDFHTFTLQLPIQNSVVSELQVFVYTLEISAKRAHPRSLSEYQFRLFPKYSQPSWHQNRDHVQTLFKKKIGGHESIFWGQWYPYFGLLVMSPLGFKPDWVLPCSHLAEAYILSLRFTSDATPAELLAAFIAAKLISSTYLRRYWWESNDRSLAPWPNAQPTELCRLGYHVQTCAFTSCLPSVLTTASCRRSGQ